MAERARWLTAAIDGGRRVFSQPPAPFRHAGERLTTTPFFQNFCTQFFADLSPSESQSQWHKKTPPERLDDSDGVWMVAGPARFSGVS